MGGVSKDFVSGDHYDALLTLLDEDLLNADEDFTAEIANVVTKIGDLPPTREFKCDVCEEMCKSQQGLSRHKNVKHVSAHSHATEVRDAELMLNHLSFQQFINECAKKLCCDECFSLSTRNSFKAYYISLDETLSSYEYVKQVICDFNGDGETFVPLFYKCVSGEEIVFPRLSRRCSVLLGFEVANHVIDHLTGNANTNNIEGTPAKDLNEKEKNIVSYLSGYVLGTLYRRIRRSGN